MANLLREPTNLARFALMMCTTAAVTRASSSGLTSAWRAATRSYNVVVILTGSEEGAGVATGYVARAGIILSPSYVVISSYKDFNAIGHSLWKPRSNFYAKSATMCACRRFGWLHCLEKTEAALFVSHFETSLSCEGCIDVGLSTRTVMVMTSFCSVRRRARPRATRQPSRLDNAWHACTTWAPSGSIALENVGPQHMRRRLYYDRAAAVALARA